MMTYVRICAVLIGIRALTNFGKLFDEHSVMVFFGAILDRSQLAIPAVAVGTFMLATCVAVLGSARAAAPLLAIYSAYVLLNMAIWSVIQSDEFFRVGGMLTSATDPDTRWRWGVVGMVFYASVAIATTAVPAWLLWRAKTAADRSSR